MIIEKNLNSQMLLNIIMNDIYSMFNEIDNYKNEKLFFNDDKNIDLINELINQIYNDQGTGNLRSAFRKAILLRGFINRIMKKVI
jgi:hypothetical protein